MWKKFLIIIPVIAIIIVGLVKGTHARFAVGVAGQRIVLATDAGVVDDKSFNQDSFLGLKDFAQDYYNIDASKNNYVDGSDHTKIGVLNNYKLAVLKGADALVLPGFVHIEPLSDPASSFLDSKTVVILDAVVNKSNIISVLFNSQFAGLQAGFDASYWATRKVDGHLQGDISGDGQIRIGAFAGASNKFAVDSYLWGLFLGIQLFNITIGKDENVQVGFANSNVDGAIEQMGAANSSDPLFFTGTFALGDATKSGILGNLVDTRKADIIFPVAGPQIQDVISYRSKPVNGYSYSPYLIGIDVDQTKTYPNAAKAGRFINSAKKNLRAAVMQTLSHAKNLRTKTVDGVIGKYNTEAGVEIWDGKIAPPFRDWSESTVGGYNKVQTHALRLYEDGKGNEVIGKPGSTEETETDVILNKITAIFSDAGENTQDYLNGQKIKAIAESLATDIRKLLNPQIFNKLNKDQQ